MGSGGEHEISLKIFTICELQQLYTRTTPLVTITNECPPQQTIGVAARSELTVRHLLIYPNISSESGYEGLMKVNVTYRLD